MPYLQTRVGSPVFEVRTAGLPTSAAGAVREAVRQIDPNLPIMDVSTQIEQVERRFMQEKLFAQAYTLFGGLALLLAAIGLFGLMSYNVSRRTNEIGIRMALGAQRRDVLRLVMRESMILVAIGVVAGLAIALGAGHLVTTLLYGLPPNRRHLDRAGHRRHDHRIGRRRLHPGAAGVESRPDGRTALRVSARVTDGDQASSRDADHADSNNPRDADHADSDNPRDADHADSDNPRDADHADQTIPRDADHADSDNPRDADHADQTARGTLITRIRQSHGTPITRIRQSHGTPITRIRQSHGTPITRIRQSHGTPIRQIRHPHGDADHADQTTPRDADHADQTIPRDARLHRELASRRLRRSRGFQQFRTVGLLHSGHGTRALPRLFVHDPAELWSTTEIQQQANFEVRRLQIVKNLSLVEGIDFRPGLDFHDDGRCNNQVGSKLDDLVTFEPHGQRLFLFDRETGVSDRDRHGAAQHELGKAGQLVVRREEGIEYPIGDFVMLKVRFRIHSD